MKRIDGKNAHEDSYKLRRVVLYGSIASSGVIFSFLFLQFLSYHDVFSITVIDEMVFYAEFFLYSYGAYFLSAILAWKYGGRFSKYFDSSFFVSTIGSLIFSILVYFRTWVATASEPALPKMARYEPPFMLIVLGILIFSLVLAIITGTLTVVASLFIGEREKENGIHL